MNLKTRLYKKKILFIMGIFLLIPVITSTIAVAYIENWCVPSSVSGDGTGTVQDVYYDDDRSYNINTAKDRRVDFHFSEMDNYRKVRVLLYAPLYGWWKVSVRYVGYDEQELGRLSSSNHQTHEWNLDPSKTLDYIAIECTATSAGDTLIDYVRCLHRSY